MQVVAQGRDLDSSRIFPAAALGTGKKDMEDAGDGRRAADRNGKKRQMEKSSGRAGFDGAGEQET